MDMISRAIEKEKKISDNMSAVNQTWEAFEKCKEGKALYIFGAGSGLGYFMRNCCDHMKISGVVDNNKEIQDQKLGWYCAEAWQTEYEHLPIQNPDILNDLDRQDIVILITVLNNFQAIFKQLRQMEIDNCYSLLLLEANKRNQMPDVQYEEMSQIISDYRDWCCQQEVDKHKIVMHIGGYGGHARQITKQLLTQHFDFDIVWLVDAPDENELDRVRLVCKKNWKQYIYEVETARVWVFDIPTQSFLVKRSGQIYIQVKHWSSITLKKFGLDDKNCCTSPEMEAALKYDGEKMDYLFSGSESDEKFCESGFAFKGQAIRVGSARSDILFDSSVRTKVLNKFHLDEKVNVLLYAPTFRYKDYHVQRGMEISLDLEALRNKLTDKFGGEWLVFVRLHPFMDFFRSGLLESRYILNAGNYPDSEELVNAADSIITDYSSIMFEGAFIKKPVFLYAPDYQDFIREDREFWIDYNALPFPRAESNEELCRCIMQFDRQKYEEDLTAFLDRYGVYEDGHASERAAKFITDLMSFE